MGRWLTTLALVIAIAVAAVLIVPSLIDWNAFRAPIEREASRLAEREVKIKGDIRLRMLPSPGLVLNDLTIADPKAPKTPLLSAARFQVSAAWLPLFTGRIEIARLALNEPILRVRINKDGTTNWAVRDPRWTQAVRRKPLPAPKAKSRGNDIGLSPRGFAPMTALAAIWSPERLTFRDVTVERGTLLFTDERNGASSRADKVTGRFARAKRAGPLTGQMAFVIDGQALRIGLNVSPIVRGQPTPAAVTLGFLDGDGSLTWRGAATGLSETINRRSAAPLTFLGRVDLQSRKSGPVGRGLLAILQFDTAPANKIAGSWGRIRSLPVSMSGTLNLTKDALTLANARGALGKTTASVIASRGRGAPAFNLAIAADIIYIDEIIDFTPTSGMRLAPLGAASGPMQGLGGCHCNGEAKLTAPLVMFGTQRLGDLKVDVRLSGDGAEVTQGHLGMPGETEINATGKLPPPGTANGTVFDGQLAFKSNNPRALLEWLKFDTSRMSPNALKLVTLDGPARLVTRTPSEQSGLRGTQGERYVVPEINGAKLALDNQTFTVSASFDDRPPRRILLHVDGDFFDADAYGLNALWLPAAPFTSSGWSLTLWGRAARSGDVDLAVKLASMRLARQSVTGFDAAVTRTENGPTNARLTIADISGYKVSADAVRAKMVNDAPPDMSAHFNVSGAGKPITLPLAGRGLPGSLRLALALEQRDGTANYTLDGAIGDIKLKGGGSGPASTQTLPDMDRFDLSADLSQGEAQLAGTLRGLTVAPTFDGNLTVDAMNFAAFMRELGYTYEPRRKDLGALSIVSEMTASGERVDVSTFAASVGQDNLNASGVLLLNDRAKLTADIAIGRISLDGYLPAPDKASVWSTERLKLDLFRRFDGAIHLTADRFEIGPYDLRKLDTGISILDSTIETQSTKATLYGGALSLTGSARITDDGPDGMLRGSLAGFDWTKGAAKLFPALGTSGSGKADARFAVTAKGKSLFDLVRTLGGTMDVSGSGGTIDGFDVAAWSKGLGGVSGAEAFLRLVKSTLGNGSTGLQTFRVAGTSTKGVITLSNGRLGLSGGTAQLGGTINLPQRSMSVRLTAQSTEHTDVHVGLIAAGPLAGPARFYDFKEIEGASAQRLGIARGGLRSQDVPKDLRDMLRTPPGN